VINRIKRFWQRLRTHILFVPGLLSLVGIILAVALVETDRRFDTDEIRDIPWLFRAGATGAHAVLSTIATAMIQLAAITFSVTIVSLTLRSQQFGPRLLRNFTGDQVNQVVLGTFVGTFIYSLLVLRAVRDLGDDVNMDDATFVPFAAVTFAIVLALISLALFVVFIDRVVTSIQATSVIAQASGEAHSAIERLFPEPLGDGPPREDDTPADHLFDRPVEILARKTGFIQSVASDELMEVAREADLVIRMEAPIGGFVIKGTPLVVASPRDRVDEEVAKRIHKQFGIGQNRTVTSDPEFGVRQVVDVAVKALSPSDNDPTTACTAIEYLGAVLIDFATRSVPSPQRRDEDGVIRVVALGPNFRRMVDLAFNQVREHGESDVAATMQLLETVTRVARAVKDAPRRAVLEEHVWKISRGAAAAIRDPIDRQAVNRRLQLAMEALGRGEAGTMHYLVPLTSEPGG